MSEGDASKSEMAASTTKATRALAEGTHSGKRRQAGDGCRWYAGGGGRQGKTAIPFHSGQPGLHSGG